MKKVKIFDYKGMARTEEIESFEKATGYSFPNVYKAFISQFNAAYPELENFSFYNSFLSKEDSRNISFYGYGQNIPDYDRIDWAQDDDDYAPVGIVIVGRSANGDYICFDYRENPTTDNPPIVVMYHDVYDDNDKMYVDFVAKDFETFMDSLYGYDDNDNKIYPEDE